FFSSRRRHTRSKRDWSSDVCSSDLRGAASLLRAMARPDEAARDAARLADSLRRVLGESGAEGSPLLGGRSMSWRFSAFDVEFAEIGRAACRERVERSRGAGMVSRKE